MNIKLLTISVSASAILTAASPMVPSSMSTDNGGIKKAIDAYSDGAGVLLINQSADTKFDNSTMNKLVFKYGDAAKASNATLKSQVSVLSTTATATEKNDAATKLELAKVVINPPANGTECNDGNPQTITDIWSGGLCAGNNVEGLDCDDTVPQTINDTYRNGVCSGINVEGLACNDNFGYTYVDKYHNGVCGGVVAQSCQAVKDLLGTTTSGIYSIKPGQVESSVTCEMSVNGGGWELVSSLSKPDGIYNTSCTSWNNGAYSTCNSATLNDPTTTWSINLPAGTFMFMYKQRNNTASPCNASLTTQYRINAGVYNVTVTTAWSTVFKEEVYSSASNHTFSFSTANGGYTAGVCDDNGYVNSVGVYKK